MKVKNLCITFSGLVCLLFFSPLYFWRGAALTYLDIVAVRDVFAVIQEPFRLDPCAVTCKTGAPCEYNNELDLRIIVLTYNRPESLRQCLRYVSRIDTLGDRVGVDIWIDRDKKDNSVDNRTLIVAQNFKETWENGIACIHVQDHHASIYGQWIDTWRPKTDTTREMGLILEDDIDVSHLAYKWLKTIKRRFRDDPDIAGYGLQMENLKIEIGPWVELHGPESEVVFLYKMFGPWGYSPKPRFWRRFQDWFHEICKNKTFHPYVPNIKYTKWYKSFEKKGTQDTMWSQWFVYFCYINDLFTVHSNLVSFLNRTDCLLDTNRREKGLHFSKKERLRHQRFLLKTWDPRFEDLPKKPIRYNYDGNIIPY